MKYLSLFSGIGGFEKAIQNVLPDAECIGFSEINKYASAIYRYHYPEHKELGNVRDIIPEQLPDFDLLVGGFPCQTFSIAGKRAGFDDTRGTLFFEIARILRDKRPANFVLENVEGLLSHDESKTFQTILGVLSDLGYRVEWQVLNSKHFGVPQNRPRVFFVGHLGKGSGQQVFPLESEAERYTPRDDGLANCITAGQSKESFLLENMQLRRLTPIECERLQGFPDDWTKYGIIDGKKITISDTQRYKCCGNAVTTNVIEAIIRKGINE